MKKKDNLDYKTSKVRYWAAILGLVAIVISLIILLVKTFFPTESTDLSVHNSSNNAKKDTTTIVEHPTPVPNIVVEKPSYDTIKLVIPSRLSNYSIDIDGKPAKIIDRTPILAKILIQKKETSHQITLKGDDRTCEITRFITGNQTLTINLGNCD